MAQNTKIFFDVTLPLSGETVVWPGDSGISIRRMNSIENGDMYNLSRLEMSAHAGTHIDSPLHFIREGKGVAEIDLLVLCGDAFVVHFPDKKLISAGDLEKAAIPAGTKRLLIKTDNSGFFSEMPARFHEDFSSIDESAAEWIVGQGIVLVGIDYFSIAPYAGPEPVHRILLDKGIVIVEAMDLGKIATGTYDLICLPLKLVQCDGAPARVLLVRHD